MLQVLLDKQGMYDDDRTIPQELKDVIVLKCCSYFSILSLHNLMLLSVEQVSLKQSNPLLVFSKTHSLQGFLCFYKKIKKKQKSSLLLIFFSCFTFFHVFSSIP